MEDEVSDPCCTSEREVRYIPAGAVNPRRYIEVALVTEAPCTDDERDIAESEGGSTVAFGLCRTEDRPAIDSYFHLDRLSQSMGINT